ncbi:hypothetical protein BTHERMOSOX_235 [Bathymodiolus thermophilus thioautotrophic gill symbiont]|uniref:PIN domain-containing protein n=2 Tax=Bathymodiolus thermophilus thioautotrophic gill symbiont TaxID=2360 RepID=A0A8H8XCR4_9GAMM|nr:type II toxin-antitoxin system VapC family toxin [Bathymodiolus thermophilus thioautotrophic gill symbiont]CAB5500433.1 hypothetical protein THERMOS_1208 [Bathymodiolus thermophilus thioautotrophic gill symbiont]SHA12275.1 hypothetical protein BTHERMOSOX_235 [Bathymodiolus thermophilus thioautotrophic gill symbiont]
MYIIDTHIFLWLIKYPEKINPHQLQILQNARENIYISNISFLEIALKFQKGKLELFGFSPEQLVKIAKKMNLKIIDIDAQTMANSHQLPPVKKHKDPFDRLLVWLCLQNNWTLLSADNKLNEYTQQGLKWI